MTGHDYQESDRAVRKIPARDGEEIPFRADGEDWVVSWHPPDMPPDGTPHGSLGLCSTGDGGIVLISQDGELWDLPAGRPEGNETWEETLRREMREEACATVIRAKLLGFSRGSCLAGPQAGRVIVRSLWQAEVELAPWKPQFEISYRRMVTAAAVIDEVAIPNGLAQIISRALQEAAFT